MRHNAKIVVGRKREASAASGIAEPQKRSSSELSSKQNESTITKSSSVSIKSTDDSALGSMKNSTPISDWKVNHPINSMVLCLSDRGAGAPINIHELNERMAAVTTIEEQAILASRNGNDFMAEEMQRFAEQLKERVRTENVLYMFAFEVAKQAEVAKNYWFKQKKYLEMGKWDAVMKAAQHLTMLDVDYDYPTQTQLDGGQNSIQIQPVATSQKQKKSVSAANARKRKVKVSEAQKGNNEKGDSVTKKDKKNLDVVTKEMFVARLNEPVNRNGFQLENKLGEGLVYKNFQIFCGVCGGREIAYATMNQHCSGKQHRKNKFAGIEK